MALDDYLPFDPDSRDTDTDDDIEEMFDLLGIDVWRDIFADVFDPTLDFSEVRGHLYNTPEEAFKDLVDRGIIFFSEILYYPDEDKYAIVVHKY